MSSDELTDQELDEQFRKMTDHFIDQANQLVSAQHNPENVSLALLHAASRFNAFVVSAHAPTLSDYEGELDKAKVFFQSTYEQMLSDNLQDYKSVYQEDFKYQHLMAAQN